MQFDMKEFGLRLAKLRIEHGYTQERMATILNVDRTHISKIEAGTRACSVDLMVQFSALFGVSLDYLILGRQENDIPDNPAMELNFVITKLIEIREKL